MLVDHSDELPCRGVYYLHHGLQRRIRITLVHDKATNLKWKDVKELVVGRIRFVFQLFILFDHSLITRPWIISYSISEIT